MGKTKEPEAKDLIPLLVELAEKGEPVRAPTGKYWKALLDRKYVEKCPDPNAPPPKKKGAAPKLTHVRLTPAGWHFLSTHASPKAALEVLPGFLARLAAPASADPTLSTVAARLDGMRSTLDEIQSVVRSLQANRANEAESISTVVEGFGRKVSEAVEKVKSFAAVQPANPPTPTPVRLRPDGEVRRFVEEWWREKGYACQFNELKEYLDGHGQKLSVGEFQDLLRSMHQSDQIRLGESGKTLDELPISELALLMSNKVMYDVYPRDRSA